MTRNRKERCSNSGGERLFVLNFLVAFLCHRFPLDIGKEHGWFPGSVWIQWWGEILPVPGIQTRSSNPYPVIEIIVDLVYLLIDVHQSVCVCFFSRLSTRLNVHVNTDDSPFTRFRYPRFYSGIVRGINTLSAVTAETAAQAY
jgi:hypothetical protein